MAYLLDSDVFIQASNMHYNFAFCSAFWAWIDREHAAGKILSIDKVLDEIAEGQYGELKPWAEARQSLFVKSADSVQTADCLTRVALWVSQHYDEVGYRDFFKGADFRLVGYALAHNHILVTQENTRGGKAKVKIPDACDAVGVKCYNTWDLLKAERPKFILG
jgi:hypothetical protein